MSHMDQVTQSNAANAEESASSSEELNAQAHDLQKMVGMLEVIVHGADHRPAARALAAPTNRPKLARPARAMRLAAANGAAVLPLADDDLDF